MTGQLRPDELIRILRAEFVTRPGGVPGGLCVTFTCGATGWRASGGTIVRTLVHEAAFQLDSAGNARGAYSVDLQQTRGAVGQVVSGEYSFLHGRNSTIAADHSVGFGWDIVLAATAPVIPEYNFAQGVSIYMGKYAYACMSFGIVNDIDSAEAFSGGQYLVHALGESHDFDEANYVFVFGANNDVIDEAFGAYSFGENNDFEATSGTDFPTYSGQYAAIGCLQKGDVWSSFQTGEDHEILGTGLAPTIWVIQGGFECYADQVRTNLIIGENATSHELSGNGYYNGRFVLNNGLNDWYPASPYYGMNQASLFSQEGWISTWNVAWTTEWQFPILVDTMWYFSAVIVGTDGGATNSYIWKIEGGIKNDGGVTALLAGSVTVTNLYRDVATKEWQVLADNVNDRLIFQFRDTAGPDATPCNLQLRLVTDEVGND